MLGIPETEEHLLGSSLPEGDLPQPELGISSPPLPPLSEELFSMFSALGEGVIFV